MRVGLQRRSDASLHVYVNGLDQGVAAYNLPRVGVKSIRICVGESGEVDDMGGGGGGGG